jgi:hypothetical protein
MRAKTKAKSKSQVPPLRVPLTPEQREALRRPHEGPSAEELRLIPEADFTKGFVRRGPEALQEVLAHARAKRGRPKKGETAAGTSTKSLRLTDAEWALLEKQAKRQRVSLHALLRQAVAELLRKAG